MRTFEILGTRVGFVSGCVIVTGRVRFPHLQKRTREKRKSVRFPRLEKRTREGRNSKMTESPETCNFPVNWAKDGARSSNDQSTSCSVVRGIVRQACIASSTLFCFLALSACMVAAKAGAAMTFRISGVLSRKESRTCTRELNRVLRITLSFRRRRSFPADTACFWAPVTKARARFLFRITFCAL